MKYYSLKAGLITDKEIMLKKAGHGVGCNYNVFEGKLHDAMTKHLYSIYEDFWE